MGRRGSGADHVIAEIQIRVVDKREAFNLWVDPCAVGPQISIEEAV
jgi:hypothetical protein